VTLENWNPLEALTTLAGKAIDAKAASSRANFDTGQVYGVDEYGRAYQRGTASGPTSSLDPRLVLLGVGLVAVVLVVVLAKS
jgi:hypothetical protein